MELRQRVMDQQDEIAHVLGTENVVTEGQDVNDPDLVNVTTENVVEIEIETESVSVTGIGNVTKTGTMLRHTAGKDLAVETEKESTENVAEKTAQLDKQCVFV